MFELYSIHNSRVTLTKLAEGSKNAMGEKMNHMRHTAKEHSFAIYRGGVLVSSTWVSNLGKKG